LILDLSLEYLSYDPNFTDDMDEDQDEDMDGEEDEDEYDHCFSGLVVEYP
jgi:cullin-associated NEDD8-dissociated protein 1